MTYEEFICSVRESRENIWFKYSERHHINPRCLGGTDEEENLIYLTIKEHFIAHKLLYEENTENDKIFLAYWRLCNGKVKISTPEEYESARMRFSAYQTGRTVSEETREKLRKAALGKSHTLEQLQKLHESSIGNRNHFYGKFHTEETRKKISQSLRGRKLSPECCERISASLKGRTVSEEHRNSIRQANTRRVWKSESKDKMSASKSGVPLSATTKENMSKSRKDKVYMCKQEEFLRIYIDRCDISSYEIDGWKRGRGKECKLMR